MYDVLYFDPAQHYSVLASGLTRESAAEVARAEARSRHVGRMFLAGSAAVPRSHAVLIVRTG
jgi:hypothetical protein